jgi:co-chaperonin GroES (HSP10)
VFVETTLKVGDYILTVMHKGVDLQCGEDYLQVLREEDCMVLVVPARESKKKK